MTLGKDGAVTPNADPLVFVACYNQFDNLAHQPRGYPATDTLWVYRLHRKSATLTLLTKTSAISNPAFIRFHPQKNILYTCTEDITKDNEIVAFSVSPTTGELVKLGSVSAEGKSTCYLTIAADQRHMLFVNYWDSVIGTIPVSPTGLLGPVKHKRAPATPVVARDIADHLNNRQSEPHAHAIVLDPYVNRVAYVPDLGEDDIKQYVYDEATGQLRYTCTISCGPKEGKPHGPRYLEFHPTMNTVYVVNELSSTVSVFEFDMAAADSLTEGSNVQTLRFIQNISTIPTAYPRKSNTCGRIAVDPKGLHVFVSNRGHDSIAVFRIDDDSSSCGEGGKLSIVSYCHTRGRTPRHFQFDPLGEFVLCANQDTNSITLFKFDQESSELSFTGESYNVPSPNFVCVETMKTGVRSRREAPRIHKALAEQDTVIAPTHGHSHHGGLARL